MLTRLAHPPALPDLYCHGAGHHIPGGQVLSVGCIALHETLSFAVDQDTSFTTTTLCDQTTGPIDACKDLSERGRGRSMKQTATGQWSSTCNSSDAHLSGGTGQTPNPDRAGQLWSPWRFHLRCWCVLTCSWNRFFRILWRNREESCIQQWAEDDEASLLFICECHTR